MDKENKASSCETEHSKLMQIINFRFPHTYKRIGLIAAGLILAFLIVYKFAGYNDLVIKDLLRTTMLFCLLVASLSKEKFEDEYIDHLRAQSYVLSFVCAIAYSISLPLIAIILDVLITNITGDGSVNVHKTSGFEVMFILICFQLMFFKMLKLFGRA